MSENRRALPALLAGAVLFGLSAAALAWSQPRAFFPAYLAMMCAWSTIPLGCLPILMIGALIRGHWIDVLRPALQVGAALIPLVGVLFVPVLFGIGFIYPWAQGPVQAEMPAFRAIWLAPSFFVLRTVVVFAAFSTLGVLVARNPDRTRLAPVGLIAYALLGSWAGIDWMLSVEPRYHSSIFGLIVLSQQLVGGLSFGLLAAWARGRLDKVGGLGAVLLSAILLWAYFHAMQYIVAWMANIPLEADWYLRRNTGIWAVILWLLAGVQFGAPFLALLIEPIRKSPAWLAAIAALTICFRPLETSWLVIPALVPEPSTMWTALSALVSFAGIGCMLGAGFLALSTRFSGSGLSHGLAEGSGVA